jgi:hypothetical protein
LIIEDSSWLDNLACGTMRVGPGGEPARPFRKCGPFDTCARGSRKVFNLYYI